MLVVDMFLLWCHSLAENTKNPSRSLCGVLCSLISLSRQTSHPQWWVIIPLFLCMCVFWWDDDVGCGWPWLKYGVG